MGCNKSILTTVFILMISHTFPTVILSEVKNLLYVPSNDQLIETIEELRVRGLPIVRYPNIKNYFIKEIPKQEWLDEWLTYKIRQPVFKTETTLDSTSDVRVTTFISYEKEPIDIILEPAVKFGNSQLWPTKKYKIAAADYERVFTRVAVKSFSFLLGKERFAIGQSPRHNLLLSGSFPPMDGVLAAYENLRFKISFLFSRLEDLLADTLEYMFNGDTIYTDTVNSRRFISLHRVDLLPKDWINIGFTEAVIYGGPNVIPDLHYLNPIALWLPYQFIKGVDNNIFWGIDGRIDIKNLAVYGELLIDDFQLLPDAQKEPNHIGCMVGIEVADPLKLQRIFILSEYTRITRWTYTSFIPWQRWEYLGYPIGHPMGPDFDNVFAKVTYHFTPTVDFYGEISYTRHGGGKVNALWPIPEHPRINGTYFPTNNFLSPTVQTYLDTRLGISIFKISRYNLNIFAEVGICKPSYKKYIPVGKIAITWR
ncbi:MAG: capsule assembly Wzi family protein [bacterium]|nr:capsule assembly Wzi family protein [bacterium]